MSHSISSAFTEKDIARFWSKVNKTSGCWIWKSGKNNDGYGWFFFQGRARRAHRLSYEIAFGPIVNNLHVLHRCDNPSCVRPDHLFLGTVVDNNADRDAKGRQVTPSGERHHNSKLSLEDVQAIREEYARGGVFQTEIAKRYGVDHSTISHIVRGVNWR